MTALKLLLILLVTQCKLSGVVGHFLLFKPRLQNNTSALARHSKHILFTDACIITNVADMKLKFRLLYAVELNKHVEIS